MQNCHDIRMMQVKADCQKGGKMKPTKLNHQKKVNGASASCRKKRIFFLSGLFTVVISLSFQNTLFASAPIIFESPTPQNRGAFSRDLSSGDVNSDGHDDIIVGAHFENKVHVFSGNSHDLLYTLSLPDAAVCDERSDCRYGTSVWVEDENDDSIPYVIVGAPYVDNGDSSGRVYVYNGNTGGLLYSLSPEPASNGFGHDVAAGDVNGDGQADIFVSEDNTLSVFNGVTQDLIYNFETLAQTYLASTDVNYDGSDDIVVGNPTADLAYVIDGAEGSVLFIMHIPDDSTCDLGHSAVECNFGFAIAAGSDRYGALIVVGASHEDLVVPDQGRVYVFDDVGDMVSSLTTSNPNSGCVHAECNRFGTSVATADLNGDDILDIVVGANAEPLGGIDGQGRAYMFEFNRSTYRYEHTETYDSPSPIELDEVLFGSKVALGDTDDDGNHDIIVGALWDDLDEVDQGLVYLYEQKVFLPFDPIIRLLPEEIFWPIGKYPIPFAIEVSVTIYDEKYYAADTDWWILAGTDSGWFHYNMSRQQWIKGMEVSRQGALKEIKEEKLSIAGLPYGSHKLFFGIDAKMDGKLDQKTSFNTLAVEIDKEF